MSYGVCVSSQLNFFDETISESDERRRGMMVFKGRESGSCVYVVCGLWCVCGSTNGRGPVTVK